MYLRKQNEYLSPLARRREGNLFTLSPSTLPNCILQLSVSLSFCLSVFNLQIASALHCTVPVHWPRDESRANQFVQYATHCRERYSIFIFEHSAILPFVCVPLCRCRLVSFEIRHTGQCKENVLLLWLDRHRARVLIPWWASTSEWMTIRRCTRPNVLLIVPVSRVQGCLYWVLSGYFILIVRTSASKTSE